MSSLHDEWVGLNDKARRETMKIRLNEFGENLKLADKARANIADLRDELELIGSVMKDAEPVQVSPSPGDDRIAKIVDEIDQLELLLTRIELKNRALVRALNSLADDEQREIVWNVWIYHRESIRGMADRCHLSKSSMWRKSDEALLFLFDRLYLRVGTDLDPK